MSNNPQSHLFSDTDPQAEAVLINLLRNKQASEKIHMLNQLNATLRTLTLSGLRQRYPSAGKIELKLRLAELLYGPELAQKIFSATKK